MAMDGLWLSLAAKKEAKASCRLLVSTLCILQFLHELGGDIKIPSRNTRIWVQKNVKAFSV